MIEKTIEKTKWVFVGIVGQKSISKDCIEIINDDLKLECTNLSSISELFPLLSNPGFSADYISIDIITIAPQTGELIDNKNTYVIGIPYQSVNTVFRSGNWWLF